MKSTIFSVLFGLIFSLTINSQTFTIPHDTIIATIETSDKLHNDMANIDSVSIKVVWKIVSHDFPSDWGSSLAICDNNVCYTNGGNFLLNGSAKTTGFINVGDTGIFYIWPDLTSASAGTHYLQVNMTHNSYSKDSWYIITKSTTGITTFKQSSALVSTFPNPTSDQLNVLFDESLGVKNIEISNMNGQLVYSNPISINSKIDVSQIPAGSYFVHLFNENRHIVGVSKFNKQ